MRSALLVSSDYPGALASGADALIVDAATAATSAGKGPALYLRLPPLDDAGALDGLTAALALRPRGVVLPLAAGGADVQRLGARLAVEEARLGLPDGAIRVWALATESPEAIFALSSYRGASQRLEGLIWSVAPLDAALRARAPRRDIGPFRLARDLTLIAARAAGVLALDAPFLDGADLEGLRAEALTARADGFDGKTAVNAAQVQIINEVFG